MSTIQAAMAQLLPAERQACEGKELLSLNAAISRTLLTIEPECQLARDLRKIQIRIRRHILATLVEEEIADTAQGPNQYEPSLEGILPHPDTILPSVEEELHYGPARLSTPTVGGTPDETPGLAPVMNRSDGTNNEFPMAKKRPADNELGSAAKRPRTWLGAITRGLFA